MFCKAKLRFENPEGILSIILNYKFLIDERKCKFWTLVD